MMKNVLTPREYEIIQELAKGYAEAYIAKKLGVSYATVTQAVNRALYKLHVPIARGTLNPAAVLVAMYWDEHKEHGLWSHEIELEDNRKLPRNCGRQRGEPYVQSA